MERNTACYAPAEGWRKKHIRRTCMRASRPVVLRMIEEADSVATLASRTAYGSDSADRLQRVRTLLQSEMLARFMYELTQNTKFGSSEVALGKNRIDREGDSDGLISECARSSSLRSLMDAAELQYAASGRIWDVARRGFQAKNYGAVPFRGVQNVQKSYEHRTSSRV